MKIIECKVINSSTTLVLNGNKAGDTVASELYVNPLADATIALRGFVSPDDNVGVQLTAVDVGSLKKVSTVTTAGNYMYMVGSYYKVDISVEGEADIIIKTLF